VEKSFVAGADISEFSQFSVEEGAQLAAQKYYSILWKT
jgi:enoyl-CoA hydratase